jgi:hypothetical protein
MEGAAFRSLSPLLFLLYIEPLLRWIHVGGRGYRFGCATRPHPTPNKCARMLTTSTVSRRRSPTYACRHKTQHLCKRFSLPINGRQSQLQHSTGTSTQTVHGDRNAQTVARQLEGQLQIQASTPNPSVLETLPLPRGAPHDARLGLTPGQRPDSRKLNRRATRTDAPTRSSDSSNGA